MANVARPLEALRHVAARRTDPDPPHPETTATLVRASADQRRVRMGYALVVKEPRKDDEARSRRERREATFDKGTCGDLSTAEPVD